MGAAQTYGGWISERPVATGRKFGVIVFVGWMAAAGAGLASIGTGGELSLEHLQRNTKQVQRAAPAVEVAGQFLRTPSENLTRIREVLNPAVSDLATTFGVSRQSVYNWLNGEQVAEENAAKLRDLAQAADVLAHEGIVVNTMLLKRRFANGKTLMQVSQAGGSARAVPDQIESA